MFPALNRFPVKIANTLILKKLVQAIQEGVERSEEWEPIEIQINLAVVGGYCNLLYARVVDDALWLIPPDWYVDEIKEEPAGWFCSLTNSKEFVYSNREPTLARAICVAALRGRIFLQENNAN